MNRLIRIYLVEDDPDWVGMLKLYLSQEQDMYIVGSSDTAEDALSKLVDLKVDVVLMDIHLKNQEAEGILAALELSRNDGLKIIMLSADSSDACITRAFAAGAVNYVVKSRVRALPELIRQAAVNEIPIEALRQEYLRLKREELLRPLTLAEREVYDLLESGHSHEQILSALFTERSTLKTHINRILKKLSVKNTREAVEKVRSYGLKV